MNRQSTLLRHTISIVIPNQKSYQNQELTPSKRSEKNQGKTTQPLNLFLPGTGHSPAPRSKQSLLKIMKEQVRSKYRRSVHPKNILAINING